MDDLSTPVTPLPKKKSSRRITTSPYFATPQPKKVSSQRTTISPYFETPQPKKVMVSSRQTTTSPYFAAPEPRKVSSKRTRTSPYSKPAARSLRTKESTSFYHILSNSVSPESGSDSSLSVQHKVVNPSCKLCRAQADTKDTCFCSRLSAFLSLFIRLSCVKPRLIQESVAYSPWKIILCTTLLNKTSGKVAIPVFHELVKIYPDPAALAAAEVEDVSGLLRPLGLHTVRAKRLIDVSKACVADPPAVGCLRKPRRPVYVDSPDKYANNFRYRYPPTPISHFAGVGPYAFDSYRMFCGQDNEWKDVIPNDKELIRYLRWKWGFEQRRRWDPVVGPQGVVDTHYLESLISHLKLTAPGVSET